MPNISVMKSSNFLKKEDVEDGVMVTISGVSQENVAKQGAPEELRWCIHFNEFEKPMVCNSTNSQLIAKFTRSEETDDWAGKQIILYHDPSISYGGKLVGGIRVRAVPKATQPAPRQAPAVAAPATTGAGAARTALKNKFRAHPDFNTTLMPEDINEYMVNTFGVKLDELSEADAKVALDSFDSIVDTVSIPF